MPADDRDTRPQPARPEREKVETRRLESPTVVQSAAGPIVFGPGLDDFNQYDDPC